MRKFKTQNNFINIINILILVISFLVAFVFSGKKKKPLKIKTKKFKKTFSLLKSITTQISTQQKLKKTNEIHIEEAILFEI